MVAARERGVPGREDSQAHWFGLTLINTVTHSHWSSGRLGAGAAFGSVAGPGLCGPAGFFPPLTARLSSWER